MCTPYPSSSTYQNKTPSFCTIRPAKKPVKINKSLCHDVIRPLTIMYNIILVRTDVYAVAR